MALALLAAAVPATGGTCTPAKAALKAGELALTDRGALVSVKALSEKGVAAVVFPKGGETEVPISSLAASVREIGGLRVGDPVLDTRPERGGHAVMAVRRLFSNCKALVTLPRGGGVVMNVAELRRRFE